MLTCDTVRIMQKWHRSVISIMMDTTCQFVLRRVIDRRINLSAEYCESCCLMCSAMPRWS